MVYKQPKSRYWWYKFTWNGRLIRKSTKQTNKRVAEQMEAAYRTSLAKGEVGISDRKPAPTLEEFVEADFLPFLERTSPTKLTFYASRTANLRSYTRLARAPLDEIDHDLVQEFIEFRKEHRFEFRTGKKGGRKGSESGKPLAISTLNRDLATLRRILKLAVEWKRVSTGGKIRLLPGENRRDRAITEAEEAAYLNSASIVAAEKEAAYKDALNGIRATERGQQPRKPDAFRLRDVATIILTAGLRPAECYQLRPENLREPGSIWVFNGKTPAARRRIPIMDNRLKAILEMRVAQVGDDGWLFPNADTQSGHIEESSLSGDHARALKASGVAAFDLYVLRHTCLTRWGEYMDAARLKFYAGHEDFKTTLRYIHPRDESMEEAMEKAKAAREARLAKAGHTSGHTAENHGLPQNGECEVIN